MNTGGVAASFASDSSDYLDPGPIEMAAQELTCKGMAEWEFLGEAH